MSRNKLLDRIFPKPNAGSELIIPSRHPVQIGLIIGFIIASFFQFFDGPVAGSLGSVINWQVWALLLIASIIGCGLTLVAGIIAVKKPWDAMGFSLGGFFILTFVLLIATWGYLHGYPNEFLAKREFWVNLCVALGFMWRFSELARRAGGLVLHRSTLVAEINSAKDDTTYRRED
jgi:hypothetical protein